MPQAINGTTPATPAPNIDSPAGSFITPGYGGKPADPSGGDQLSKFLDQMKTAQGAMPQASPQQYLNASSYNPFSGGDAGAGAKLKAGAQIAAKM